MGLLRSLSMPARRLLPGLLVLALAIPAGAQEPVRKLKSAPQDFRGRSVEVEGEVVEIQALSPRSRQGIYRLVDATDPSGVLIRTTDLPHTGGPFRVRASLSPELLRNGQLLLDEGSRRTLRTNTLPVALGVAGLGLAALLWAGASYVAARRRERRMRLAPPLWLIPAGTETTPAEQQAPTAHFDYTLQYVEEERSAQIEARKRRALVALAPAVLLLVAGSVWAAVQWRAEDTQPAFVLIEPEGPGEPTLLAAGTAAARPDDTLRVAVQPPAASAASAMPFDTLRPRRPRRDTTTSAVARAETTPPPVVVQDTARAPVVAAPQESVVATPPPPPPQTPEPEPVRREPEPPAPDPAAIRRAAEAELDAGIRRFTSALAAREVGTVATLYPAGGDSRRIRFLDFIRESRPTAALRSTEAAAVSDASAQAAFTVSFQWRGEFGVARRKDAKFQATARRTGTGWAFEGARLLENMP